MTRIERILTKMAEELNKHNNLLLSYREKQTKTADIISQTAKEIELLYELKEIKNL